MISIADKLSAQDDSTKLIPPDTALLQQSDSLKEPPKPPVYYKQFMSRASIYSDYYFPYDLRHDLNSDHISYSIADLTDLHSGFDQINFGPYGQPYYLFHDGLPINRFRIDEFEYDYATFSLPFTGITDSRRIPLADAVEFRSYRFISAISDNEMILMTPVIPDSGAITSAYMQKGDFGFSNTMIRFLSSAGTRARIGVNASFKNSKGYISNTEKKLENFRLYNKYQLNDSYQLQQDVIFFTSRDDIAYRNDFADYLGESRSDFLGISLGLTSNGSCTLFDKTGFVYQRFNEAVRGDHDKYRQAHEVYNLKIEKRLTWSGWENSLEIQPYYKRITFDPDYYHYSGIEISDFSAYRITQALSFNFSIKTDINKYAQTALSFDGGVEYSNCPCMSLYGQVFRLSEKPSDYELFARSPAIGYYNQSGDPVNYIISGTDALDNTRQTGFTGGFRYDKHGFKTNMYFKFADLQNYHFWQAQTIAGDTVSVGPVARDAGLIAGGVDLETKLPLKFNTKLVYSYNRIEDSDSDANLSMIPRHRAIIALYRSVAIPRLNLDVLLNFEGEYHSETFISPYNSARLDDRLLMNFSVQFNIKTLTIYYNMDNVFDSEHRTVYDYPLQRGVWWGFLWNFYN